MPAGIQVINTAGTVTIDENYQNLALRASGGMYFSENGTQLASFNYGLTLRKPLCAIRVTGQPAGVASCSTSGGVTNVRITGMAGASVTWYVFDVPYAVSNAGLQIFRGDGTLCFDAGNKYARVVDYWTASQRNQWEGMTKYYTDGRVYASAFLSSAERKQNQFTANLCGRQRYRQNITWYRQMCQITSGTNNTTYSFPAWRADGGYGDCEVFRGSFSKYSTAIAMIDVTGY